MLRVIKTHLRAAFPFPTIIFQKGFKSKKVSGSRRMRERKERRLKCSNEKGDERRFAFSSTKENSLVDKGNRNESVGASDFHPM